MIGSLFGLFGLFFIVEFHYLVIYLFIIFISVSFIFMYDSLENFMVEGGYLLDNISYILLGLCFLIWVIMVMSKVLVMCRGLYLMLMLMLFMSVGLVFMVNSYLGFYMVFEISLMPMLFYIVVGGGSFDRLEAGAYLLLYTLVVSFPFMLIIFLSLNYSGSMFIFFSSGGGFLVYLFIILAFMVKLPMYLFHLWLPKAHVEASVSGSMLLAGVMLKMSGYGVIRFMLSFKFIFFFYSYIFVILSLLGGVYASIESLRFMDMKILVAYSSVVHMGLMMGGILTLSGMGLLGGLIMMVSHGVCSSGLFGMVNLIYERLGTRSMFFCKGGLLMSASLTLFWFILCVNNMSSPPSINLFSELMIFVSILGIYVNLIWSVLLIMFFGGVYSIYLFSYSQYGKVVYNLSYKFVINIREFMLGVIHVIPVNLMFIVLSVFI